MPIGTFADFASCEAHFAKDPDVDDPAALCAYIESRSKEDDIEDGSKIIYGLDVQWMSLVDNPAVLDSTFIKSKDVRGRQMKAKSVNVGYYLRTKSFLGDMNEANYVVVAPALIPDTVDGNGEAVSKEEIYKAMLKFMEYQKVDSQHDFQDGKGEVVMNWILPKDETFELVNGGAKSLPEGTWMVGIKIKDPKEWDLIKSGQRKGFSIAGYWSAVPVKKAAKASVDNMNASELKIALETAILNLVKDYEKNTGTAVDNVRVDRGDWPGTMTYDDYVKTPIKGIYANAIIKSRTNSEPEKQPQEVKSMDENDKKELKALLEEQSKSMDASMKAQNEANVKAFADAIAANSKAMTDALAPIGVGLKTILEKMQGGQPQSDGAAPEGTKGDDKPEDEEDEKMDGEEEDEEEKSIEEKQLKERPILRRTSGAKQASGDKGQPKAKSMADIARDYKPSLTVKEE